jgi:hypothetical protein
MTKLPVIFRRAESPSDIHFIVNSWTRSLWKHQQHVKDFPILHQRRITAILENAKVMLACDSTDPSVIFGYVVWEPDVLHWVYVKHAFRKLSLCRSMLSQIDQSATKQHSHTTPSGEKAVLNASGSLYNSYILERYIK